jgi:hypothetical protein
MCDFCFCCQLYFDSGIRTSSLNRFKDDDILNKKNIVPPVQEFCREMATTPMESSAGFVQIASNPLAGTILRQNDAGNLSGSNDGSLRGFLSGNCPIRASTARQSFTA